MQASRSNGAIARGGDRVFGAVWLVFRRGLRGRSPAFGVRRPPCHDAGSDLHRLASPTSAGTDERRIRLLTGCQIPK
jgi:hypothetical protein